MQTVINYDMPSELALYLHRVGRTARAGEKGRSISLVGEGDRAMLKAAMKRSDEDKVRHRLVPAENLKSMRDRLEVIKGEVAEVLKEEVEEKAVCSDISECAVYGSVYASYLLHRSAVPRWNSIRG